MKLLTILTLTTGLASAGLIPRSISNAFGGGFGGGFGGLNNFKGFNGLNLNGLNLKDILKLGGGNNFFGGGGFGNFDLNILGNLLGQSGGFKGLSSSDLSGLGLGFDQLGASLQGFGLGINNFDFNNNRDVENAINLLLGGMCINGFDQNFFGGFGQQDKLFMLQELAGLFQLQQLGFGIDANIINGIFNGGNIFNGRFGGGFGGGFNFKGFKRAADEQKKTLKRTSLRRPAKRQECSGRVEAGAGVGAGIDIGAGIINGTEPAEGAEEAGAAAPAATTTVDVVAPAASTSAAAARK